MKTVSTLIAATLLSTAIAWPAHAAAQPISIQINQQQLVLKGQAPFNDNGTIVVPFRPVFEKLGLSIEWNQATGTITGTKEGLTITLQLGSKHARINGVVTPLAVAPKLINNSTYIPLRFVGEATGNEVIWNAQSKTVAITSKADQANPQEIKALFEKYITYSNSNNYDGFMSLIDSKSPIAAIGPQVKSQMEQSDYSTTSLDQLDIINLQPTEATVQTVETTTHHSGPFSLDNTTEYIYSLTRTASTDDWKINNLQIKAIQYTLPDQQLNAKPAVPKADETDILAVLQSNLDYTNSENVQGMLSTLDPESPVFEQTKQILSQIFAVYDLKSTLESAKIIDYTKDTAAVYTVQTSTKLKGPDFQDNRTTSVSTLKKSKEGKWLLDQTYTLSVDKLNP
ncbi:copper amine oxidase N-terminal domain-containing protein [Paenibacillus sp. FSL R10-2734]|uniref:copper amine oxidase N-terminal domain-containing protein n=1 Tax=Paenibacillus sp. FSL R10-2734 TaxID=2954691 RepID=UPI0030D86102